MKKLALLVLAAFFLAVPQPAHIAQAAPFPVYNMLEHIENPDCIVIEASRTPPEWGSKLDGYYVFQPEDLHIVTYQDHKIVQMTVYQLMGKKLKYFDDFRFSIDPMKGQWGTGDAVEWRKIEDLAPLYGPLDPETNSWQANFSTMAQTVMQYLQFERPDLYEEVTGHAAQTTPVPLLDHANPIDLARKMEAGDAGAHMSTPTLNERAAKIAGHPVYIAQAANGVSIYFHMRGDDLMQINIVLAVNDEAAYETMSDILAEAFLACGMTEEEVYALAKGGWLDAGNMGVSEGYCTATDRIIKNHIVNNTGRFEMILTAARK